MEPAMAMWVVIIFCLAVCEILWKLFSGDHACGDDALPDVESSDANGSFAVAARLEKLHGGKAFVGLRIPDPDSGFRQHIDVVLVTKMEVMVVTVRNFSRFVKVAKDGSWVCTGDKERYKPETYPDPVVEINKQVAILQSYLEQRGVPLPKRHIIGKVVLPNPNCRPPSSIALQPEVISFEKWREMQDGSYQKLNFILSTSPMWDRLELKGDRNILGEFIEFKGNQDGMQTLRNLKRSKVSRFIIQKPTMLGSGRSRLQLLYSPRDYRSEGVSSSELTEVAVEPNTEFLFQPLNAKKPLRFKLSTAVSLTLSA